MASNTEINDKDIEIIMNQTDYTKERANEMLIKYNYNKEEVILAYIKGSYHTPVNTYKKVIILIKIFIRLLRFPKIDNISGDIKLSICLSRFSLWDFINFLKINYFLLLEIHPVMLLYIFLDDDKIYSFLHQNYIMS